MFIFSIYKYWKTFHRVIDYKYEIIFIITTINCAINPVL